jgi:hypothetical protein
MSTSRAKNAASKMGALDVRDERSCIPHEDFASRTRDCRENRAMVFDQVLGNFRLIVSINNLATRLRG